MQLPDFLQDKNLTFIDIEATDKSKDRRMIQFSGIRVDANQNFSTIDIILNPEQELSNQIINLLKTDNETLAKFKTLNEEKEKILEFLKDSVVITFGAFDYPFLKEQFNLVGVEYEQEHFDLQKFLKKYSRNEVSLSNLHSLIVQKTNTKLQHDALYDAEMLMDVYYKVLELPEEELATYAKISHLLPRIAYPKHEIFTKKDFDGAWENIPKDYVNPLIINELEICFFDYKFKENNIETKTKKTIHYLKHMQYYIQKPGSQLIKIEFNYKSNVGLYTYDFYKEEAEKFLKKFLENCKNRPIFFLSVNKSKIQSFTELIYDATKTYIKLNYINLNSIKKLVKNEDTLNYYNDLLLQENKQVQSKFKGFNTWKKLK